MGQQNLPDNVLSRWAEIESQVDAIQNKIALEEASFMRRASNWGGIAALIISIAVGVFTLLDQTLIAPSERRADSLARLNEIIVEIGNSNIAATAAMTNGPGGLAAGQQANAIKLPLLAAATGIIEEYPSYVDAATLIVVTQELITAQEYDRAVRYATMARERAPVADMLIESIRMMAVANMGILDASRQDRARKLFEEAITQGNQIASVNGPWLVSNAIRDWAASEVLIANCSKAEEVFARFATDVQMPLGKSAAQTGAQLVLQAVNYAKTCPEEMFISLARRLQ